MRQNIGYKALAAAVITTAASDLLTAYKKVQRLDEMEKKGELGLHVRKAFKKKQAGKVTLTQNDISAAVFFKDDNHVRELYLDVLDLPGVPQHIVEQRDYVLTTGARLNAMVHGWLNLLKGKPRKPAAGI